MITIHSVARSSRRLLVGATVAILLLGAACGDDDGGAGAGDARADGSAGSADARVDANLGGSDAGGSADAGEPPTGMATVYVEELGIAAQGVDVVFHRRDGSVFASAATGADGRATGPVHSGSMVTVIRSSPTTVGGIEPGDEIRFEEPGPGAAGGTAQVTMQAPGPVGAFDYDVELGGCTENGGVPGVATAIPYRAACVGTGSVLNAVAYAFPSDPEAQAIAYAVATDVPVALSGDTTVAMGAWSTDWNPLDVTIVNPGGSVLFLFGDVGGDVGGVRFAGSPGGEPFFGFGGGPLAMRYPRSFFDRIAHTTYVLYGSGTTATDARAVTRYEAPADAVTLDLATALPRITAGSATPTSITWTSESALGAADVLIIGLDHDGGSWGLVLPSTATSPFPVPRLPDSFSAYRPVGAIAPTIVAIDADWVDGFDVIKATGGGALEAVPAAGTHEVRISAGGAF